MINKNKKGFTIVELVIVIAVIAILAAVLIPTFASIINRANESADIQAVRQMNMALLSESVEERPATLEEVIKILDKAGYNSEKNLTPVSKDHGFYWHSATNTILLVKDPADKPAELIFPLDNETLTSAFNDKKASWSDENGHADFYDLEDGSNYLSKNTMTIDGLKDVDELKDAIENGATNIIVNLGGALNVNQSLEIPGGVTVTLDLAGKSLTLGAEASLAVNGNVTFTNGNIVITNTTYTEEEYEAWYLGELSNEEAADFEARYFLPGIETATDAMLTLNDVTIEGNRGYCNIQNHGTITNISNSNFTVNGGYGIYNTGTITNISGSTFTVNSGYGIYNNGPATIENTTFNVKGDYGCGFENVYSDPGNPEDPTVPPDPEAVKISGGSFIAAGEQVSPLYNAGGTMTVTETTFSENGTVSYDIYSLGTQAPICSSDGSITLKDVKVEARNTSTYCSVNAKGGATIDIDGGEFTGIVSLSSSGSVLFLDGGNFTLEKEEDWIDFSSGTFSYGGVKENIILENSDNLAEHVANINRIINYNKIDFTRPNPSNYYYSIIATTTPAKDENGNDTQKTTYAIVNDKLYTKNYTTLFGDDMEGDGMGVDEDEVVTMYLNAQGFYVEEDIVVKGTLNIAYGDIRIGEAQCGADKKIIVEEGGALYLTNSIEINDVSGFDNREEFIEKYVTVASGGTVYIWDASENDGAGAYEEYTPTTETNP